MKIYLVNDGKKVDRWSPVLASIQGVINAPPVAAAFFTKRSATEYARWLKRGDDGGDFRVIALTQEKV